MESDSVRCDQENSTEVSPQFKDEKQDDFYLGAKKYWAEKVDPTIDGMLGGFASVSQVDIKGSSKFLKHLFKMKLSPGKERALDCGAGIGRITKYLLIHHFDQVDMVEQDTKFTEQAREFVGADIQKVGTIFNVGLQDFSPPEAHYDVIWCQWVLGHLTDIHLVNFFRKSVLALKQNGVLVIKENVTSSQRVEVDDVDCSVTRPLKTLESLIKEARLRILKVVRQMDMPKGLYPVYTIAARPIKE